jgi:hypothetical protein
MQFRHERIDSDPVSTQLGFCLTTDLTGNGRQDVIVGGAGAGFPGRGKIYEAEKKGYPTLRPLRSLVGFDQTTLFWYENPGWERHEVASVPALDVGATLCDITGDGRPNVLAGQGIHNTDVYWFEMPDNPRERWEPHLITDAFEKYHDLAAGDIDDDGRPEIVGLSQESETLFYYDIPSNPYQSPWPDRCRHIIDEGVKMEGICITDSTRDGSSELIAGTNIYRNGGGSWEAEPVVTDWDMTRAGVADLDGDGELEIVFSEGDSPYYGTHPGRVAWFDPPEWNETFLEKDLFCPHTLQIADFNGDGRPDIYVAEMGKEVNDDPQHLLFRNEGDGEFSRNVIASGIATHEAKAVDLNGTGNPDIVGKSYGPNHHVDVWYNET